MATLMSPFFWTDLRQVRQAFNLFAARFKPNPLWCVPLRVRASGFQWVRIIKHTSFHLQSPLLPNSLGIAFAQLQYRLDQLPILSKRQPLIQSSLQVRLMQLFLMQEIKERTSAPPWNSFQWTTEKPTGSYSLSAMDVIVSGETRKADISPNRLS